MSALNWLKLENTTIPDFDIDRMDTYFILRLVDDGLPARDYKDIHSHAYSLFKAGHIESVFVAMQGDRYVFKCVCLPEMKKDTVYKITVSINNVGHIQTTTCGCPAGVCPTGRFKHISALCYALEENYRTHHDHAHLNCKHGTGHVNVN